MSEQRGRRLARAIKLLILIVIGFGVVAFRAYPLPFVTFAILFVLVIILFIRQERAR